MPSPRFRLRLVQLTHVFFYVSRAYARWFHFHIFCLRLYQGVSGTARYDACLVLHVYTYSVLFSYFPRFSFTWEILVSVLWRRTWFLVMINENNKQHRIESFDISINRSMELSIEPLLYRACFTAHPLPWALSSVFCRPSPSVSVSFMLIWYSCWTKAFSDAPSMLCTLGVSSIFHAPEYWESCSTGGLRKHSECL